MPSHSRKTRSITTQAAELAFAVPQVVAHRSARLAMAGSAPSARDRREFERMVSEKTAAFAQSWQAMTMQTVLAQQTLALSMLRNVWSPMSWGNAAAAALASQAQGAALGILSSGMKPVHRKAVANAKRLGRTRLR